MGGVEWVVGIYICCDRDRDLWIGRELFWPAIGVASAGLPDVLQPRVLKKRSLALQGAKEGVQTLRLGSGGARLALRRDLGDGPAVQTAVRLYR